MKADARVYIMGKYNAGTETQGNEWRKLRLFNAELHKEDKESSTSLVGRAHVRYAQS